MFGGMEAHDELVEKTLRFARRELNRAIGEREREGKLCPAAWKQCGEFGLLGLCIPEELGGMGLDALATARLAEAFGRGCEDFGLVFSALAHLFACTEPIAAHASDELKHRIVPGLARGELIGANAITEAEAGSDAFALASRAERVGDHYEITGVKSFVTNGPVADLFLVYAKTAPEHGEMGISAFVVERGAPGLTVGEPFEKAGLPTSPVSQVYFDKCRVPVENRVGDEGQGSAVFTGSMHWERACLFAAYVGAMDRQLEQTIAFAQERRQFRRPIGRRQAIAHRIADMKIRLESARMLLYRACWTVDQGRDATLEISMAKVAISEAAVQSGLDMMQIHGGLGFMVESGVPRNLLSALPCTIFSGTSEIQRDLIASRLGL